MATKMKTSILSELSAYYITRMASSDAPLRQLSDRASALSEPERDQHPEKVEERGATSGGGVAFPSAAERLRGFAGPISWQPTPDVGKSSGGASGSFHFFLVRSSSPSAGAAIQYSALLDS